jgi:hypothetical protein
MLTGLDRDSMMAQGLGIGAEILGDPLTYLGLLGGGGMGALWSKAGAPMRALEMEETAIRAMQQAALRGRVGMIDDAMGAMNPSVNTALQNIDMPGVAAGSTMRSAYMHPDLTAELEAAGLLAGKGNTVPGLRVASKTYVDPNLNSMIDNVDSLGRQPPVGTNYEPLRVIAGHTVGNAKAGQVAGKGLVPTTPGVMPELPILDPQSLEALRRAGRVQGGADVLESAMSSTGGSQLAQDAGEALAYTRTNEASLNELLARALGGDMKAAQQMSSLVPDMDANLSYGAGNAMNTLASMLQRNLGMQPAMSRMINPTYNEAAMAGLAGGALGGAAGAYLYSGR